MDFPSHDAERQIREVEYELFVTPQGGARAGEELVWVVRQVQLYETIGGTYTLVVLARCEEIDLEVPMLVGADASFRMLRDEDRVVHGVVTGADYIATTQGEITVELTIAPALKLLHETRRSRVFQDLGVLDILQQVVGEIFAPRGRALDTNLLDPARYPPRDYCVQFRETDLEFFERLCGEEGIAYVFDQEGDTETVVLVDDNAAFAPIGVRASEPAGAKPPEIPVETGAANVGTDETVHQVHWSRTTAPRVTQVEAWDWKSKPPSTFEATEEDEEPPPYTIGERFEHQDQRLFEADRGRGAHRDEVAARARRLRELAQGGTDVVRGQSSVFQFRAGATFTLSGHPQQELDRTYLIVEVEHTGDVADRDAGGGEGAGANYSNRFTAIPLEVPFRPARRPKPRVFGPQTAVVVGPEGEDIHTDEHGRVMVRMLWDREQRSSVSDTSCWLRVAQMWAGPGWGSVFLPRVGMEVVVAFFDGDPDRPLVVGCVYNGANEPPYPLPQERTKSTIKTQSTPGGDGFNELRFEDAKGSEEVFLHAQKNHKEVVRNAQTRSVGASQTVSVGADQSIGVGGNRSLTVAGNETIAIGKAPPKDDELSGDPNVPPPAVTQETTVEGTIKTTARDVIEIGAGASITLDVGGTKINITPAAITLSVAGGASISLNMGVLLGAAADAVSMGLDDTGQMIASSTSGGTFSLKDAVKVGTAGNSELTMDDTVSLSSGARAKMVLDQDLKAKGKSVELKAQSASLEMSQDATLKGSTVELTSAAGTCKADAQGVSLQGPKIGVNGMAMTEVSGALVKIN